MIRTPEPPSAAEMSAWLGRRGKAPPRHRMTRGEAEVFMRDWLGADPAGLDSVVCVPRRDGEFVYRVVREPGGLFSFVPERP